MKIPVYVYVRQPKQGGVTLQLVADDGTSRTWSKHYDGQLFLAFDCDALGLLGEEPELRHKSGQGHRFLRPFAELDMQQLERFHFNLDAERADA